MGYDNTVGIFPKILPPLRKGGEITYVHNQSRRKRNFGQRFEKIQKKVRQRRYYRRPEKEGALRKAFRPPQEKGGGGEKTQLQRLKTKQILTFYT